MLWLVACGGPNTTDLSVHTLAFGGDFMLGPQLNQAVIDPAKRSAVLGDLALLRKADLALINGEGVISVGGTLVAKGEPAPHTWRVGPHAVTLLVDAGIDVVSMGNNHAGDYGPEALREEVSRLRFAGLDVTGAGLDAADARTPVYRRVGDTVIAVVGADLTGVSAYRATPNQPGTFGFNAGDVRSHDAIIEELSAVLAEARQHAHVVVFTPHWGPNWRTEPTPAIRALAHRVIGAGYDAVLGHSAHTHQGVELVDGRPVVYDAGNLGITYGGDDAAHRGMLYEVAFTQAGVTAVSAFPLAVAKNHTTLATGDLGAQILAEWDARTTALGTSFTAEGATRRIPCDAGQVEAPRSEGEPPLRTATEVIPAAALSVLDTLPPEATPAHVRWANGLTLVGYHLLVPSVGTAKAAQVITLYLRAERRLDRSLMIVLRAFNREKNVDETHWPGDWTIPGDQFPVGPIVVDRTLFSFEVPPESGVQFAVGIGALPIESDLARVDKFVVLGGVPYAADAPAIKAYLPAPGG